MNSDQQRVFNFVKSKLYSHDTPPMRHFVSGVGGTGKSYLIKTVKAFIETKIKKDVAVTAPTGISTFNIQGMTVHRLFQLPVEHGNTLPYRPLSNNVLKIIRQAMENVILIIIDEISMISNITLTYINLRLFEIFDTGDINDGWFGRIHLLMFGDLLQLSPVNEESPFISLKKNQIDKYTHSLGALNIWANLFSYDELIENMRQKNDSIYASILERVRINAVTPTDIKLINKRIIKFNINDTNNNKYNAVIVELYNLISSLPDSALVLLPTRYHCEVLKKGVLDLLPTEVINHESQDSVDAKSTST